MEVDKGSRGSDARCEAGKLLYAGKANDAAMLFADVGERDSKDGTRRPAERASKQQRDFTDVKVREKIE
jgi:hypothetical protein